jgi:predicted DNA binding protein
MGLVVEIRRLAMKKVVPRLSRHQEEIVRLALREGYFDIPRRITTKELAMKCEIPVSSLREILTRAERNVFQAYLDQMSSQF